MADEVHLDIIDKSEDAILDRFFVSQSIHGFKVFTHDSGVKIFTDEKVNIDGNPVT
ncbi:hypothetical protein D3C87_1708570 [compost metagenome]